VTTGNKKRGQGSPKAQLKTRNGANYPEGSANLRTRKIGESAGRGKHSRGDKKEDCPQVQALRAQEKGKRRTSGVGGGGQKNTIRREKSTALRAQREFLRERGKRGSRSPWPLKRVVKVWKKCKAPAAENSEVGASIRKKRNRGKPA